MLNYNTPAKFAIIVINRRTDLRSYQFVAGVHDLHASNGEGSIFRARARIRTRALNFLARTYARTPPRSSRPTAACDTRAARCAYTYTRVHTHTHTHIYAHVYMYIHIHTRARFTRAIALSPRRISPNPGFLSLSLSDPPFPPPPDNSPSS